MYELPSSLLVDNSLNCYVLNSPMLSQLERDADGGMTLLIHRERYRRFALVGPPA